MGSTAAQRISVLAVMIAFAMILPLDAQANSRCAGTHSPQAEIQAGMRIPTFNEALQIVGDHSPKVQVRKALDFIYAMPPHAFKARIDAARIFFQAIKELSDSDWKFGKFTASDGSVGYVGDQGQFVLFKTNGLILKGSFRIERDLNEYDEWNGHADNMTEYPLR